MIHEPWKALTDGNVANRDEKNKVSERNVTPTSMKVDPCRQMNL